MKNSKLKKILLMLGIMAMAVVFAGCGKKTSASTVKHITYWHVNAQTQGGAAVDDLVKKFNDTHKNIKVTAKYNPDMYKGLMQNLQSAQASGKVPDITQVGWAYDNYFASNFKYMTPTDAAKKFDGNNKFIDGNFTKRTLSFAKDSKGKLVGLPYSLSTPVLFINKDILSKYNIKEDSLSTWEGIKEASKKIHDQSGKYGLYIQEPGDTWAQQGIMLSHGADIQKGGKAAFASDNGVGAYKYYQEMVTSKLALHTPWAQGMDSFVKGDVAMAFTTIAQASHIKKSASFNASAIAAPHFEGHKTVVPVGGSMLAITAQDSEQQKAAWEFEKWMYKADAAVTWSKGTGYLPPTKVALESSAFKDYVKENPMLDPAVKTLDNAVPWTSFPKKGLQAEQAMIDARDKILSGSDVKSTLGAAQDKINAEQK
ncbi:ABC transporter substrate-binding protein [Companilactobacillus huachuanensis]|uniref:ABC transporter substrate-binding protein n=1 Tax=Companilactobacillus huachuanensis TaxID=2559914 RepID=A0ABW1RNM2_9LACO|nr:ABC transporter substrate-binding protein [Companilactobacillus huachuanensis]